VTKEDYSLFLTHYQNCRNVYIRIARNEHMVSLTLAIPEELKKEMERFPEMNWSEIAREAIKRRVLLLHKMQEFTQESELTEQEALRIGKKVNEGLAKRWKA